MNMNSSIDFKISEIRKYHFNIGFNQSYKLLLE